MTEPKRSFSELVSALAAPEAYVQGVLRNVYEHRGHGEAEEVHFAIPFGKGPPDYAVFVVMDSTPETGGGMTIGVFSGRTHRALSDKQERQLAWSGITASHSEVSEKLGALRGFPRPKTPS